MSDSDKLYQFAVEKGFDPSRVPASDSSNWCITALTPATEVAGPVTGVPDLDTQNTLTFHWRQNDTITPPASIGSDTWDVDVLQISGPGLLTFFRTKKSADPTWTQYMFTNRQYNWNSSNPTLAPSGITGGTPGNWPTDVAQFRPMYGSLTIVTNAASLTDQGMVAAGQIPPLWKPEIASSVIGEATGAATPFPVTGYASPTDWTFASLNANGFAPDFDTVLQTCTRGEMWRAKDGVYLPLRFVNGLFQWQQSNTMVYDGQGPFSNPVSSTSLWKNTTVPNTSLGTYIPMPFPAGMNHGIACFRGLAPTTTLSLYHRLGYECTTQSQSGYRAFLTPSCSPDFVMVQEYFKLCSMLKEVYPASYNEEDLLTAIIAELAANAPPPFNKILPLLARGGRQALGSKQGQRALGAAKSGASSLMNKVTGKGKNQQSEIDAVVKANEPETASSTTTPRGKQQAATKGPIPRPKPVQKAASKGGRKK